MLSDDAFRHACSAEARRHILRFSWPAVLKDLEAVYARVAEE
jgi:hypothetical protein